jgi:glutamate-1-semialdehyde 2,1-aminomutase
MATEPMTPRSTPDAGPRPEPTTNLGWYERGRAIIPGGVNSPVRAFRSVGGVPFFVQRGQGAYVWDVEGARYIDYIQSYGASILGHADPQVIAAISAAATNGTTFGAPTPGEVRLAEMLCARVPGLEMVRMVSSGTEAVMSAVRVARGATGRSTVVKFAGHYHGHSDALLAAAGSAVAEEVVADSAGVPDGAVADTRVVPWNEIPELDGEVAVVLVEPVPANMGLVPAAAGFLQALRAECDRVGALLCFDEVITGARVARGGATQLSGVTPDLWTFGKVIGGGLPVGAFGGRHDLMTNLAPLGRVYQAGTLSGNPLATAAGCAVLDRLDDAAYEQLASTAARLASGLQGAFDAAKIEAVVPQVGPLVGLFFGSAAPQNFDEARASVDRGRYPEFFHGMLERGIALAPGPYEVMFPSLSHDDAIIDETVEAAYAVASAMAEARPRSDG